MTERTPQNTLLIPLKVMLPAARAGRTYIAGPMSGIADFNYPAFNAAADALRAQGVAAINPADHGIVPGASWEDYMRSDMAQLSTCEAIHLLPGWSGSRGARLEHYVATQLGMRIEFANGAEQAVPATAKAQTSVGGQGEVLGTLASTLRAMATNYSGGHHWDHLDGDVCRRAADALAARQQVGEVDEGEEGRFVELYPDREVPLGAKVYLVPSEQPTHPVAPRQSSGGGEVVDVEAALTAGDPNWQKHCRPNLDGSERLFFAVRDIAELRAMLAGESKPLPGSGLTVVRTNPDAPATVPYQTAHTLIGEAYQAGTEGVGFGDQAEKLFDAMECHAKRERMAVVCTAPQPPAQGVDLAKLRECLAGGVQFANDGYDGHARRKLEEALALIDRQEAK